MYIEKEILDKVNEWLTPVFDDQTQNAIKEMMTSSPAELKESFYKNLEFGTGGMRGIMGIGTNRINRYTLGKNTQGLANYIKYVFPDEEWKVAVAYDCRHNSKSLAQTVSNVFAANGIKVFLFSDLRPTPELSFAVKHLNCHAGIVLTASHNPPEYNGYKVYWKDGGQLVPPQDKDVIRHIEGVSYNQIRFTPNNDLIEKIDLEVDEAFFQSTLKHASFNTPSKFKERLSIVFTPLHGTSVKAIPAVLERAGYNQVTLIKEQAEPDGNFPTVLSPNPEDPEALTLAIQKAEEIKADIVIGTDPDGDRLGIAVRNLNGNLVLLNGNQTMVIMTAFLLEQWKHKHSFKGNEFIGSTIVSTPMMLELATAYGIECKVGLTGFKWIAKMIKDHPDQQFIGGGEESFGFMVGDAVRDKDAVAASLLACEIAAQAKAAGSSFYRELLNLYLDHGFYKEHLVSITKKGIEGLKEIENMMRSLRKNPPYTINEQKVVMIEDYLNQTALNTFTKEIETLTLPQSDVLIYYLEDGTKICARPSGTEPKIKFYISVNEPLYSLKEFEETENRLDNKIQAIIQELKLN